MLALIAVFLFASLLIAAMNMSYDKQDKKSELKRIQKKIAALENKKSE